MEPETAKFGKPEKLADGKRVRVSVEVFGKGVFKVSRNMKDKPKILIFHHFRGLAAIIGLLSALQLNVPSRL